VQCRIMSTSSRSSPTLSTIEPSLPRKTDNDVWASALAAATWQPMTTTEQEEYDFPTLPAAVVLDESSNNEEHHHPSSAPEEDKEDATRTTIVRDNDFPAGNSSSTDQVITPLDDFARPSSSSSSSAASMVIGTATAAISMSKESSIEASSSSASPPPDYLSSSSWSFSPMRFTGVTLFITMLTSYMFILRQARRHRVKIANGQVPSIQMMHDWKTRRELEMADMIKRQAATASGSSSTTDHRLEFINLKAAASTRSSRTGFLFQPAVGSLSPYSRFFTFPAILEQQQESSCSTNFSSSLSIRNPTSFRNLQEQDKVLEKLQRDTDEDEEEEPSKSKTSLLVRSDPWTCQFDQFSSSMQLRSPLSNVSKNNVVDNDTEVATNIAIENTRISTIALPSLVAFRTPSSAARKKALVLNGVYVPSRHIPHQDIQLPPLVPPREAEEKQEESPKKALSLRSIFPAVVEPPISPTTISSTGAIVSSSASLKDAGNNASSSVELSQDLSPIAPHHASTTDSFFSCLSDEEKHKVVSSNAEPSCRLVRAVTPPSSSLVSSPLSYNTISPAPVASSGRRRWVPTTEVLESSQSPDGLFRHHAGQVDASSSNTTIYAQQPMKRRIAKKGVVPPLPWNAPPPEHFL
jgi:hypothetical protein